METLLELAASTVRKAGALLERTDTPADIEAPVLTAPDEYPRLPSSTILGLDTVESMMTSRYATVVGILGDPESGKTACLVGLYLLVSHARLQGWSFADSLSLMAFEEIARGARRWLDGALPQQLTLHTQLADDRRPGFLHLKLRHDSDGRVVDFMLPDLPGEWSLDLVRKGDLGRFEFLKAADVLWLVTDGRALMKPGREAVVHRLGLLISRLAPLYGERFPRVILVPTRRDHGQVPDAILARIRTELRRFNIALEVVPVAPFSDDVTIIPGHGLSELVESSVPAASEQPALWPTSSVKPGARAYLSFRRSE